MYAWGEGLYADFVEPKILPEVGGDGSPASSGADAGTSRRSPFFSCVRKRKETLCVAPFAGPKSWSTPTRIAGDALQRLGSSCGNRISSRQKFTRCNPNKNRPVGEGGGEPSPGNAGRLQESTVQAFGCKVEPRSRQRRTLFCIRFCDEDGTAGRRPVVVASAQRASASTGLNAHTPEYPVTNRRKGDGLTNRQSWATSRRAWCRVSGTPRSREACRPKNQLPLVEFLHSISWCF
jgi:hypothetical protein